MVSPYHLAGNVRFPIEYVLHLLQGLLTFRPTIAPPRALTTMPAQGRGSGNERPRKQPSPEAARPHLECPPTPRALCSSQADGDGAWDSPEGRGVLGHHAGPSDAGAGGGINFAGPA